MIIENEKNNFLNSTFIQNSFNKGVVEDEFRYNTEFIFEKSGKEIKKKVNDVLKNVIDTASKEIKEAFKILKELNEKPTDEVYVYGLNKEKIQDLNLKRFSYSVLNESENMIISNGLNQYPQVKYSYSDIRDQSDYHKYNSCIEKYVDLLKDKFILETFKNNLDDNKKYNLNLKQITVLGF